MEIREYKKLHAEWYELVSAAKKHTEEIEFLARCIASSSQPVLELGSGTGRLMIPLRERGFDVCGIDTSPAMMERCRATCSGKGLSCDLHLQAMQNLNLARRFGLVLLASGGLGLLTLDSDIDATFERVKAHLKPGGLFVYEFETLPSGDRAKRDDGRWEGDWVCGPGEVVIAFRRRHRYDPESRIWRQLMVLEKFVAGRLVETEANERVGRFFAVDEAVQYAERAGFVDIRATHWLTDDPPREDSRVVTIRCRKPEAPPNA